MHEMERESPFRFVIDGGRKLEDVSFREVAALLDGFAMLVERGSADILNRPMHPGPGRQEGPIEEASRIRLVSLTSGSIVATVLPAAPTPLPEGGFDLSAETLSEQAIGLVLDVAGGQTAKGGQSTTTSRIGLFVRFSVSRIAASVRSSASGT